MMTVLEQRMMEVITRQLPIIARCLEEIVLILREHCDGKDS